MKGKQSVDGKTNSVNPVSITLRLVDETRRKCADSCLALKLRTRGLYSL